MKSSAMAAVGIALVYLPLTVEPHMLFWIQRAEMEGGASHTSIRACIFGILMASAEATK